MTVTTETIVLINLLKIICENVEFKNTISNSDFQPNMALHVVLRLLLEDVYVLCFFSSFGDLISKKKKFQSFKLPGKKYLSPFVGTKETFLRKLPSQG